MQLIVCRNWKCYIHDCDHDKLPVNSVSNRHNNEWNRDDHFPSHRDGHHYGIPEHSDCHHSINRDEYGESELFFFQQHVFIDASFFKLFSICQHVSVHTSF